MGEAADERGSRLILAELRWAPWSTPKAIATAKGLSLTRVSSVLKDLRALGRVVRRGRGRYGRWSCVENRKTVDDRDVLLGMGGGRAHLARAAAPWPCPPLPSAGPSLSIWGLDARLRVQLEERARRWFLAQLAERGHYGGHLQKTLRKTSHRGPNRAKERSPHAGSPSIEELGLMADICELTREEAEAAVVSVHGLTPDSAVLGPFPKPLTPAWAWLVGFFMGCGSGTYRTRRARHGGHNVERALRFRFDATVRPLFEEQMLAVGASWRYSAYFQAKAEMYAGPVTRKGRTRCIAIACKPMYDLLELAGIELRGSQEHERGRGKAARHLRKYVPPWCLSNDEMAHALVEGYLNTTAAQQYWAKANRGHVYARVRIANITDDPVSQREWARIIEAELRRCGVARVGLSEGRQGRETSLHVTSHRDFVALIRNFRIYTQKMLNAAALGGHKHVR